MTTTPPETDTPLLALAYSNRPERQAHLPPVDEHGFLLLVREAHPDLEHAQQVHRARGETVHVFRDRVSGEFIVLFQRRNGRHAVKESGFPGWTSSTSWPGCGRQPRCRCRVPRDAPAFGLRRARGPAVEASTDAVRTGTPRLFCSAGRGHARRAAFPHLLAR